MLALYISDRIRYTGQSTEQLEKLRDFHRHYFDHKTAKDILFLIKEDQISLEKIKSLFFDKKALINYTNDLILNIFEAYFNMRDSSVLNSMIYDEISEEHAIFIRDNILLNSFDISFFFLTEALTSNSTNLYYEPLISYGDFTPTSYFPLIDPIKYPLEYFLVDKNKNLRHLSDK